jgi:hypothetical protein
VYVHPPYHPSFIKAHRQLFPLYTTRSLLASKITGKEATPSAIMTPAELHLEPLTQTPSRKNNAGFRKTEARIMTLTAI